MKKKIKELFEYRKLPKLLKNVPKKERKALLNSLVDLQIAIYKLDQYLEENWKLKQKKLKAHWEDIFGKVQSCGYSRNEAFAMTSHIRRYQLHETQLRENLSPTRLNKQYYYHYKSCDVRLLRQIIKDKSLNDANSLVDDWRSFDLITEINDDITDVFEDQHTINGNLFLIMILEKGVEYAHHTFVTLISQILSIELFKVNSSVTQLKIKKWTEKEAQRTIKLLQKNCQILNDQKETLVSELSNFL